MVASRSLKLRRPDRCVVCNAALETGTSAFWEAEAKTITCLACLRRSAEQTDEAPTPDSERPELGTRLARRLGAAPLQRTPRAT